MSVETSRNASRKSSTSCCLRGGTSEPYGNTRIFIIKGILQRENPESYIYIYIARNGEAFFQDIFQKTCKPHQAIYFYYASHNKFEIVTSTSHLFLQTFLLKKPNKQHPQKTKKSSNMSCVLCIFCNFLLLMDKIRLTTKDDENIPLFIGFQPSQVVQDFFHQQ